MSTPNISPIAPQAPGEGYVQKEQSGPGKVSRDSTADVKQNLPFPQEKGKELTKEDIEKVAEFLNSSTDVFDLSIRFQVAEKSDRIIISVFDKETDELIRQIPPQEILDLTERLNEMVGVLFNETA